MGLTPLTLPLKATEVFQGILGCSQEEDKPSLADTRKYEIIWWIYPLFFSEGEVSVYPASNCRTSISSQRALQISVSQTAHQGHI